MSNSSIRTIAIVFLALLVGASVFVLPAAATTTTLAGDGSDQVTDFNASSSDHLEYSLSSDGTDFSTDGSSTLYMNVSYDGDDYAEISADVSDGTSASQTLNMSHDKLDDLPGDAGANTTVTVTAWGEDADGNITTSATTFDVDIEFANTYAVTTVDDRSADIEEADSGFFSLDTLMFWSSSDTPDLHTYDQTVGVDGDNTTVTLNDGTSNGTDAFDDAIGDEKESGDLLYTASAGVDGTPVLAFYESANEDLVDDNSTYAVYDNGVWTFELGDDYADASQVDVYASSQPYTDVSDFDGDELSSLFIEDADLSRWDLVSSFGVDSFGVFGFDLITLQTGSIGLLGFTFAVSRRRGIAG